MHFFVVIKLFNENQNQIFLKIFFCLKCKIDLEIGKPKFASKSFIVLNKPLYLAINFTKQFFVLRQILQFVVLIIFLVLHLSSQITANKQGFCEQNILKTINLLNIFLNPLLVNFQTLKLHYKQANLCSVHQLM